MSEPSPSTYALLVTAGPFYDVSTHKLIPVNDPTETSIDSPKISCHLSVRIKNYRGLPLNSPSTCAYFEKKPHTSDLYSIAFRFTLKDTGEELTADDLLFGNDFDEPIRDSLPWGTGTALKIVKSAIDPGIEGDPYADQPYLFGPLFSSINILNLSPPSSDPLDPSDLHEGGAERGLALRQKHNIPSDVGGRRKYFLNEDNRRAFSLNSDEAKGLEYRCDFFNPYLDFNEFALKLPGFSLGMMKFWDGQPLRYVLKTRKGGELFVVRFALVEKGDVEKEAERWKSGRLEESKGAMGTKDAGTGGGFQDEGVD
ncbi:MAG: hypothetical protein Q9162_000144 [Coniocarpon cinnabarinum]